MSLPTATELKPELHTHMKNIETPAVVIDLDIMENNIQSYAEFARKQDVNLRSHTKSHKTPEIAHIQQRFTNDGGIVCQTLSEAEVMATSGIDDIYLSYMVVGEKKLGRLIQLAKKVESFATTVDCSGNILPLQQSAAKYDEMIDVVLELDIGLKRVGVQPGESAVNTAQLIAAQSNLRLTGVMAYEGHLSYPDSNENTRSSSTYKSLCCEAMDTVADTVRRIEDTGISIDEVKVGSTVTSRYSGTHPIVTEINPGMYPFNDAHLLAAPHISIEDCALKVKTSVISKPTSDRVIVDAGSKSISLELKQNPIPISNDVNYYNSSEEHGWIDIRESEDNIEVGDNLSFIPPHVCPTINLHDTLIGIRNNRVEEVWSVQGRGKVK